MSEEPTTLPNQDADISAARGAAERMTLREQWNDLSPAEQKRAKQALAVSGALLAVGATVVGPEVVDALNGPNFSEDKREYVVQPGDGVQNAAEDIYGSEKIDIREATNYISQDPANIDVLSDGLQPGEILIIPDHVEG